MKKIVLICIVLSIYFAQNSIPSSTTAWPMLHGNKERTKFCEGPAPDSPYVLWSKNVDNGFIDSPIISNGTLYIMGNESFSVLDLKTGEILKSFDFPGWVTLTASENVLFFPSGFHLTCFDSEKESILWTSPTIGNSTSNPVVYGGRVFMGGGWCPWTSAADKMMENKLLCFDQFTGEVMWEFTAKGKICTPPALSDRVLYIGSWDEYVYALYIDNGNILWKTNIGARIHQAPVACKDFILVTADNTYCLDKKTGEIMWESPVEGGESPAVGYTSIFLVVDNSVYALDFEGGILWEKSVESDITSLLVADNMIFVWTMKGTLISLNVCTGCQVWYYDTKLSTQNLVNPPAGTLALSDGILVVTTHEGRIFAFGIDPEKYLEKAEEYEKENKYYFAYQFYEKAIDQGITKESIKEKLKELEKKMAYTPDQLEEYNKLVSQAYSLLYERKNDQALHILAKAHTKASQLHIETQELECLIQYLHDKKREQTVRIGLIAGSFLLLLFVVMRGKMFRNER
jgi:outer membrane protein assembly factor BamB